MLLTIGTTHQPATDLGYLLGKNPARTQTFDLNFGQAHVFYPEADATRCTAALLLDVDPVGLVRRPKGSEDFALSQYTNDRPYVASSLMSVAIGRVLGSALAGRSRERPELAQQAIDLEARLAVVPLRGGESLLRSLFEPLGYEVHATRHALAPDLPGWGDSVYATVTLRGTLRLGELLRHLTVLIPVLDDDKHYWVGEQEIDTLLARGEGWLAEHPERERITDRFLKHQRALTRQALRRLCDDQDDPDRTDEQSERLEDALERPLTLNEQRLAAVTQTLRQHGVRRVIDLGCGEGKLLRELLRDRSFEHVTGLDVSFRALERARTRLRVEQMSEHERARLTLLQGSLTYRDARIGDYDGACVVEVIEHIDRPRLRAFEHVLFEHAHPPCVVVTTPNAEYNPRFEGLAPGAMRHRDHRFEWTREQFERWASRVAKSHGYRVSFEPIGPVDPQLGAPTQMGVFVR